MATKTASDVTEPLENPPADDDSTTNLATLEKSLMLGASYCALLGIVFGALFIYQTLPNSRVDLEKADTTCFVTGYVIGLCPIDHRGLCVTSKLLAQFTWGNGVNSSDLVVSGSDKYHYDMTIEEARVKLPYYVPLNTKFQCCLRKWLPEEDDDKATLELGECWRPFVPSADHELLKFMWEVFSIGFGIATLVVFIGAHIVRRLRLRREKQKIM